MVRSPLKFRGDSKRFVSGTLSPVASKGLVKPDTSLAWRGLSTSFGSQDFRKMSSGRQERAPKRHREDRDPQGSVGTNRDVRRDTEREHKRSRHDEAGAGKSGEIVLAGRHVLVKAARQARASVRLCADDAARRRDRERGKDRDRPPERERPDRDRLQDHPRGAERPRATREREPEKERLRERLPRWSGYENLHEIYCQMVMLAV